MMRRNRKRRRGGFTLLEVLLVLIILVVIGGIVAVNYVGIQAGAQSDVARNQMQRFKSVLQIYQVQVGSLPSKLEALRERPSDLSDPARWKGPYLDEEIPTDPWGNAYKYAPSGTGFEIRSPGPDGQDGTDDDIVVTAS